MGEPVLTVYSRAHCHLCDEMLEALRNTRGLERFRIVVTDVDEDPALVRRYGEDVPVLTHEGRELCRHRLDPAALAAYLATLA